MGAIVPHAEIIAIGSELLLGGREETNSIWLSRWLAARGIELRVKSAVSDATQDIAEAVKLAARRSRVVILTGGLGPTNDDRTRHGVAAATRRRLTRSVEAWSGIADRLAVWGRTPTAAQRRQALIPSGAGVLPNALGTAPGFHLTWRGVLIAALPGVPAEAERMLEPLAAVLEEQHIGHRGAILQRELHTFGLPEPEVDRLTSRIARRYRDMEFSVLASPLGVTVVLTAMPGRGSRSAERRLVQACRGLRAVLGSHVFGADGKTMEQVVGETLLKQRLTVAVAESCTGGLIGHRLTQMPGSSGYLDRGVICYSNTAKEEMIGVSASVLRRYGAVSAETAAAMAAGMRSTARTDLALSVTGIAGPGGGSDRKPVGLVYIGLRARPALKSKRRPDAITREYRFHGSRHTIKQRASQAALDLLRRWLFRLPPQGK